MRASTTLMAWITVSLPLAPALSAQGSDFVRPSDWKIRADRPGVDLRRDVYFVEMPPGWHLTTGPGVILWKPEHRVEGEGRVEVEVYLFDPEGRSEPFGIFLGGRGLDGGDEHYTAFLIREGGHFAVVQRRGGRMDMLHPWTTTPSMVTFAAKPHDAATARNVLRVEVDEDVVDFVVNGRRVVRLPRERVDVQGTVGLRVESGLNLHVSRLDVRGGG